MFNSVSFHILNICLICFGLTIASIFIFPGSADYENLRYTTSSIITIDLYYLTKILFFLIFILFLRFFIRLDWIRTIFLVTSPVVISLFFREGFDFLSLFVSMIVISFVSWNKSIIIIFLSLLAYLLTNEISILFCILCSFFLKNVYEFDFRKSIFYLAIVTLTFLIFFQQFYLIIFDSILNKITSTEVTYERNSDFNILKSMVVLIISHSYFIFSDTTSIIFAGATCLPYILLGVIFYYKNKLRKFLFSSTIYIFTVSFFKTFQHLRLFPFLFVQYVEVLSKRYALILIYYNLFLYILHLFVFGVLSFDNVKIINIFAL